MTTNLQAPNHVVVRQVEDATILLNTRTGRYFTLDDLGTAVWDRLTRPMSVEAACDDLLNAYDADPVGLRTDVDALIARLTELGLLEPRA